VKKVLSLLLAIAMIFSLSVPFTIGGGNMLNIAVDTLEGVVYRGDRDIEIYVRVPADPIWSAIDARFYFDPLALTFKSFVLNPEILRQSDEGEANIFIINKDNIAQGEIGIGFATVSYIGGYEGYYPAEYDYLGVLTFSVNEDAPLGFTAIEIEVRDVDAVNGDVTVSVPFTVQNGGFTIACAHDWKLSESKEATCDEDGYSKYTCSLCSGEKTDTVTAIGHAWDNGVVTLPTCEDDGFVTFTCTNDSAHTRTEAGEAAIGHAWTEVKREEPTCDDEGFIEYICKNDRNHIKTDSVAAIGHTWGEGKVIPPTCEEDGFTEYVCVNDSAHTKREEIVEKIGHDFGEWEQIKAPTCGEGGKKQRICKNNPSHIETEEIPALEHDWNEGVVITPTCEAEGYTFYTCKNDPAHTKTEDVVAALGHSYTEIGRSDATCNDDGWIDYVCENDDTHKYRRILAALGHTKENGIQSIAPTCSSKGEMKYTCPICFEVFTEEIDVDPDAHEWDEVWKVTKEPSCSIAGIEICHCILNGEHINSRPIEPLGHIWDEGELTLAPTCSTEGVVSYVCQRNKLHTLTETVEPVADAHEYEENTVPPTCDAEGYTEHVCKYNPEHRYQTNPVPATGHEWQGWYLVVDATCDTEGIIERPCAKCDKFERISLEATGHDFSEWEQTKAPTVFEEGEEQRVCKNDPSHIEIRVIPKLEHIPGDMDLDGGITVADALALLRIAAEIAQATEFDLEVGDMDADGSITVADALSVLRTAAGFID